MVLSWMWEPRCMVLVHRPSYCIVVVFAWQEIFTSPNSRRTQIHSFSICELTARKNPFFKVLGHRWRWIPKWQKLIQLGDVMAERIWQTCNDEYVSFGIFSYIAL
jgi:hypothetical protein